MERDHLHKRSNDIDLQEENNSSWVRRHWKLVFIPIVGLSILNVRFCVDYLKKDGPYHRFTPRKRNSINKLRGGLVGGIFAVVVGFVFPYLRQRYYLSNRTLIIGGLIVFAIVSVLSGISLFYLDKWFMENDEYQ